MSEPTTVSIARSLAKWYELGSMKCKPNKTATVIKRVEKVKLTMVIANPMRRLKSKAIDSRVLSCVRLKRTKVAIHPATVPQRRPVLR